MLYTHNKAMYMIKVQQLLQHTVKTSLINVRQKEVQRLKKCVWR